MSKMPTKYNNGPIIKLDDIPQEDIIQALNDFSEGSTGLKRCLSVMWKNNLKTLACCAGNEDSFEEAYILMNENVDLFSYLSDRLLLNDMVSISCDKYNRQSISFIGPSTYKEHFFAILADDILSGKKQNVQNIRNKINKPIPQDWKIHGIVYQMMKSMIPTVGPIKRIRLLSLCRQLNESTLEQQKKIIQKCYNELAQVQQQNEVNKRK